MATAAGPKIVTDGLVFGYDTNYGVADINTSTKFFTGKPTSNLNSNPLFTGSSYTDGQIVTGSAWGGDTGYGRLATNTSPDGGGLMYINHNTSNPAGSGGFYNDWPVTRYTLTNGYTYTRSWWAKSNVTQSFSGHMCSCNRDSTNTYIVGSSITLTPEWQKFSQTFTYSGPTSTDWKFRHINYNNSVVYLANVQLEVASSYSPFVDGTRSDTGSLIDLKETTDIDVSNVSFDSTGQPEMDGSSDYIDLGADLAVSPINQGWTAEYVFNSDSAEVLQHFNGCEEDTHNAGWIALYQNKLQVWNRSPGIWKKGSTVFASNTWYHVAFVQESGTSMQFYVNGVAEGGDHVSYSWNASKSAFFARYIGRYEYGGYSRYFNGHIPVTRLYDKGLSAAEIKQNYNTLKNRFDI